jgi:hypothetical protein
MRFNAASGVLSYNMVIRGIKGIIRMAILELVLSGLYFDQLVVNRLHYVSAGDSGPVTDSFALLAATGFIPPEPPAVLFDGATLAGSWQGNISEAYIFQSCYVKNLYDPTDFVEAPYPATITGDASGEACAPFMAYGFSSSRVRTDIRRGSKRIAGVVESSVDAGGVLSAGGLAIVNSLAERLSEVLTYDDAGASLTLTPAVLGFEEYTTPSGKRAYRKYATESAQLSHAAVGIVYTGKSTVRSQVSRQYARGA